MVAEVERARPEPAEPAMFRLETIGRSMWPLLRPGDVALFAPLSSPPREGEVVLYRLGEQLVAHRVIGRLPDGRLRLRGDFTRAEDPPLDPEALLGRLCGIERSGRAIPADRMDLRLGGALLPPLQRHLPTALDWLRDGFLRGVHGFDRALTAGPVRRARRRLLRPDAHITVATVRDAADLDAHDRRRNRDPAEYRSLLEAAPFAEAFCLVARVGDARRIVGCTHLLEPEWTRAAGIGGDLWIHDTYVEHRYRGLGLGRTLTRRLLQEAARRGARPRIRVAVRQDNARSRLLHERIGFRPVGELGGHLLLELSLAGFAAVS